MEYSIVSKYCFYREFLSNEVTYISLVFNIQLIKVKVWTLQPIHHVLFFFTSFHIFTFSRYIFYKLVSNVYLQVHYWWKIINGSFCEKKIKIIKKKSKTKLCGNVSHEGSGPIVPVPVILTLCFEVLCSIRKLKL